MPRKQRIYEPLDYDLPDQDYNLTDPPGDEDWEEQRYRATLTRPMSFSPARTGAFATSFFTAPPPERPSVTWQPGSFFLAPPLDTDRERAS